MGIFEKKIPYQESSWYGSERIFIVKRSDSDIIRRPRLFVAKGSLAVESILLNDIEKIVEESLNDGYLNHNSIRVILPSRSLIAHFGRRIIDHFGRSIAGISLQTLFGIAVEILERAGKTYIFSEDSIFEILVRRFSRNEKELRDPLEHLMDGYGSVCGTIVDFFDAGFHEAQVEPLEERLSSLEREYEDDIELMRARALVRVAGLTLEAMKGAGVYRTSMVIQKAKEFLEMDPVNLLPSRALLIHGFADATGVSLDFIESLMKNLGAWVYLNYPPDPSNPEVPDLGIRFTNRFSSRLQGITTPELRKDKRPIIPSIKMFKAPGASAEIREVANRILCLLKAGVSPEGIGVVGRDLQKYLVPIRTHFTRLGIPFSGQSTLGPKDASGRRIQALLDMMRDRMDVTSDIWLDAAGGAFSGLIHDLRISFHRLGAGRLKDVVELDLGGFLDQNGDFSLPVIKAIEWIEEKETPVTIRRKIPGSFLIKAIEMGMKIKEFWDKWPSVCNFREHLNRLNLFIKEGLCWDPDLSAQKEVRWAIEKLKKEIPPSFDMSYEEFILILARSFSGLGSPPLGGLGGGVQVLNVMEARGWTFEYLFIIGMNKDIFPRRIREDPILSDSIRKAIRDLLPDLAIKEEGYEEERYLFAQLASSSTDITISWQDVDEDGRPFTRSPLVERIILAGRVGHVERVKTIMSGHGDYKSGKGDHLFKTAYEHALHFSISGKRDLFSKVLPIAIAEAMGNLRSGGPQEEELAISRARISVLKEIESDYHHLDGIQRVKELGPYFGFIGTLKERADPRMGKLYITTIEDMAICPWQAFIRRIIHLDKPPDSLSDLPGADPRLIGMVVHSVLERIASRHFSSIRGGEKVIKLGKVNAVSRPADAIIDSILKEEAERVIREEGIGLKGLSRILAIQALPYIQEALRHDWPDENSLVKVLGTEVDGSFYIRDLNGNKRRIFFRADRVDLIGDSIMLTDYKTGKPISNVVKEATKYRHLLNGVKRGEYLQVVAYALSDIIPWRSEGRYLFLKPDLPEGARVFSVRPEDREIVESFQEVVKIVLQAWDEGVFPPRLFGHDLEKEPERCRYCECSQACLRGDSGAKRRLKDWIKRMNENLQRRWEILPPERAILDLWSMGAKV